ncbi:hypothetical protein N657DRAFT_313061 [Parathielavia appendiculata]|uniref:Uncharacterized protein n=1 Tax=Parathielavia appendiculata TaxID=2587402 RepID=A0AAN6U501_9PEZI|nr:hypothetical protein N657DRAFT_313061 [Parathielavia appendiculata]
MRLAAAMYVCVCRSQWFGSIHLSVMASLTEKHSQFWGNLKKLKGSGIDNCLHALSSSQMPIHSLRHDCFSPLRTILNLRCADGAREWDQTSFRFEKLAMHDELTMEPRRVERHRMARSQGQRYSGRCRMIRRPLWCGQGIIGGCDRVSSCNSGSVFVPSAWDYRQI